MNHREFFEQLAESWGDEEDTLRVKKILELINPRKWKKILDVGTGTGVLLPSLPAGRVIGVDLSFKMLRKAREKFGSSSHFIQGEAEHLPLIDNFFDCVICFRSFPHFSKKEKALAEIHRVLKKDGRLYIAHTASREEVNSFHTNLGHVVSGDQIPDDSQMRRMFENAGFHEIRVVDQENLYIVSAIK